MRPDWTDLPLIVRGHRAANSQDKLLVICSSAGSASWQRLCQNLIEISLQPASRRFICNRHIRAKNCRQVLARGNDMALLMRCKSTPKIVGRADIDVAVAEFKEIDVPQAQSPYAPDGASGDTLCPVGLRVACHPKPDRAKGGGAGGIRTLDRALQPYNGLANRRLQPLGHSSIEADMPDAGASRKRQIPGCLIRSHLATRGLLSEALD